MRILVATDGSARSSQALAHAAHLASALEAEITLLHVLDPWSELSDEETAHSRVHVDALAADWERTLADQLAAHDARGTTHVAVTEEGERAGDVIVEVAAATRARLIAMATDGAGLVRRAALGSVATHVLGRSAVPVMLVGRRVEAASVTLPYRVLLTTDGSEASAAVLPAIRGLLRGAPKERVALALLRVYQSAYGDPSREEALDACRRELAALRRRAPRGVPLETEVVEQRALGGADGAILTQAARRGAHAIWMATHGHSFAHQLLAGSVALSTVRNAPIPVVLTRPRT